MSHQSEIMRQLADAASQGWDGIDDPKGLVAAGQQMVQQREREEERRQAKIFADCFAGLEGRACLDLLRKKTIELPPTQAELDERDPLAFALSQARRQGAANIVWTIEAALALARGDEQKDA